MIAVLPLDQRRITWCGRVSKNMRTTYCNRSKSNKRGVNTNLRSVVFRGGDVKLMGMSLEEVGGAGKELLEK